MNMVLSRPSPKTQFTESEAAEELGISLDQLRSLIRNVVNVKDGELDEIPVSQLQPADLLLLKMISSAGCTLPDSAA